MPLQIWQDFTDLYNFDCADCVTEEELAKERYEGLERLEILFFVIRKTILNFTA